MEYAYTELVGEDHMESGLTAAEQALDQRAGELTYDMAAIPPTKGFRPCAATRGTTCYPTQRETAS